MDPIGCGLGFPLRHKFHFEIKFLKPYYCLMKLSYLILCSFIFLLSCKESRNENQDSTVEIPEEEAEAEVEAEAEYIQEGISSEDQAFIDGVFQSQKPLFKAAARKNSLFLLRYLEFQGDNKLARQVRAILDKEEHYMYYDLRVLEVDEENH